MIKNIFFDFDGTLVDTNDVIIASWQHTYRHYWGKEVPVERITSCFGEPLLITMAREFPEVPAEESAAVYRTYQQEEAYKLVKIFPGIVELLEKLQEEGYNLGIVTSRTRSSAERYMDMFDIKKFFADMVSCEDTTVHKPNPEPMLLGLEKLNAKAEESIMIGDSPFDIGCANGAGVKSVLVGWAITASENDLVGEAVPTYTINKPQQLLDILADLNK